MARVKTIAQQDESIGKMTVEATCIMARCTDAFLADLVKAAAERASATGKRNPNKNPRKRPATSEFAPQVVLPEDVRQAVSAEERFDFLRPVVNALQDGGGSLGAAGAKGKKKGGSNSSKTAAGCGGVGESAKRKGKGSTRSAASVIDSVPNLVAFDGATGPTAGSRGNLLTLAGLDAEGQRRALLGGVGAAAPGLGGDDDDDYDI
ncbi:unnamed protein product [Hapterophycus canaliculatus]